MNQEIEKVSISLNRKDALSVINALQSGISEREQFNKELPSVQLLELLRGAFMNSTAGVHFTKVN